VPALTLLRMDAVDPIPDTTCGSQTCISYDYQASGAHELLWYGKSFSGAAISGTRLAIVRLFGQWPQSQVVVFGTAPVIASVVITPVMFNPWAPTIRTQNTLGAEIRLNIASFRGPNVTVMAQFRNLNPDSGSILRTITTVVGPRLTGLLLGWTCRQRRMGRPGPVRSDPYGLGHRR